MTQPPTTTTDSLVADLAEAATQPKSWMKQPGEVHDKRGVPIYPGDLIKSPHFVGARKKRYYLYHVATYNRQEKVMEMVPASHLEPSLSKDGGRYWLRQEYVENAEVISGYGPGDILSYEDRPRVKVEKGGV